MIAFAHLLDAAIYPVQPYLIGIAIAFWIVGAVSQVRASLNRSRILGVPKRISRGFLVGIIGFAAIIGSEFAIFGLIEYAARMEIAPMLSSRIESVTVNGKPVEPSDAIVKALREMPSTTMAHHSHPTVCYRIALGSERGPLELDPCRDSDDPHEYWVYYRTSTRRG